MQPEFKLDQMIIPTTAITAGSKNYAYVDTKEFDFLAIEIVEMSASAATQLTALSLSETDTAPTAFTDGTVLTQFTGGTAVGTAAGFVLPTPSSTVGNNYRFNIDLRGRKRYICLEFEPGVTTRAAAVALLFRGESGPAQGTVATSTEGCRLVVSG